MSLPRCRGSDKSEPVTKSGRMNATPTIIQRNGEKRISLRFSPFSQSLRAGSLASALPVLFLPRVGVRGLRSFGPRGAHRLAPVATTSRFIHRDSDPSCESSGERRIPLRFSPFSQNLRAGSLAAALHAFPRMTSALVRFESSL